MIRGLVLPGLPAGVEHRGWSPPVAEATCCQKGFPLFTHHAVFMIYTITASPMAGFVYALFMLGTLFSLNPTLAFAQSTSESDVSVTLGGILQAETSYGWITQDEEGGERDRLGFGLRRTRLQVTARIGPKGGAFVHLDADGGTFGILDAFVMYNPSRHLRLRLGRMASAQPRAFILTPVIAMDATERAAIALLWNGATLGSKGRDFGLDLRYMNEQVEAIFFIHNGDGSFDRMLGNYQQNIVGDVTGGVDRSLSKMAVSSYIAFRPQAVRGLEVGGFAGYNGSRNPNTVAGGEGRTYASYSAHAYWGAEPGSQPIRLKADVIGVRYEEVPRVLSQHTLGLSMLGALAVHQAAELFGRFETFDPSLDQEGLRMFFVTAGLSFSPSKMRGRPYSQERLTLGYSARIPEDDDVPMHHLLVLQVQFRF